MDSSSSKSRGWAGEESTVDIVLPDDSVFNSYYKYGPTPDNPMGIGTSSSTTGHTGAEILGNVVRLHFIDGGRGDGDLLVNGSLSDPGGLVDVDRGCALVSVSRVLTIRRDPTLGHDR